MNKFTILALVLSIFFQPQGTVMAHIWDAEHAISSEHALEIIQHQFPELNAKHIKFLDNGWNNSVYVINDELIFRFPRRGRAVPLVAHEVYILPKIAPLLELQIPIPLWAGKPHADYPWQFMGYRMLPGTTACQVDLTDAERSALAAPLARFLATLHAIPVLQDFRQHLPQPTFIQVDKQVIIPKILTDLQELESLGLLKNKEQLYAIANEAQTLRSAQYTTLVHGDLHIRHLLLNVDRQLTGIIDWSDVHIGDPAVDISIAHSVLPPQAHATFRKNYGEISQETWLLARLRALCHCIAMVLYGHKVHDTNLEREGQRGLAYIAQQITV